MPCPFRGLPYREQLARKRRTVTEAFAAHPRLRDAVIEEPVGSRDLFGYRNVAKLSVRARRGGGLRAGVYVPGSHRLAEASGCAVQHPAINRVLSDTLREAERAGVPAWDEPSRSGELRYLVVRYSAWTRKTLLVLVTASRRVPGLDELARRLGRRQPLIGGIVQNVNPDPGNVILGSQWFSLQGQPAMLERIGNLKLQTSPGAFLQANLWTARRIYETALEWARPSTDDRVLDLFCGVGPLTLTLAAHARLAIGIEENPDAVRDAKSNARRNGFHNARFRAGAAEQLLPELASELGEIRVVTLNPPRKGARPQVLDAVARLAPARVVYISCHPATLARDLDRLAERGFRTMRVRPFDMLPQTEHVEVVALAERDTGHA